VEVREVEARVRREHRAQPFVVVLIDHPDRERAVRLALEGVEEAPQVVHPAHRRDDEVERREPRRHAP
jgi:hypothetical protein